MHDQDTDLRAGKRLHATPASDVASAPPRWRVPLGVLCVALALGLGPGSAGAAPKGKPGIPDRKLQKAIDKAIATGADFLRASQKQNGRIGDVVHHGHGGKDIYKIGTTALGGLALLAAGDKLGDKHVDAAMAYCRREEKNYAQAGSRTTYDIGTLLMFVTEYYRTPASKGKRKKKHTVTKKDAGNPCGMPDDVRVWIKEMAIWLAGTQYADGGFGYPAHREDLSNTQYALLGLRAARECGGIVPKKVFKRVIERLLVLQEKDGPKVLRTLGGEKKGDPIYKIDGGDRARGWGYMSSAGTATGSMTTAGIASLAICHDALTQPKRWSQYDARLAGRVTRAIADGFAWLAVNFTVERNPPASAPAWHFYYLYGLERAAVFANRILIGEHDWYLQGARYLVARQRGDGSWNTGALGGKEYDANTVLDTAWAILFLKKATRPMKPIPMPVVTPANPK